MKFFHEAVSPTFSKPSRRHQWFLKTSVTRERYPSLSKFRPKAASIADYVMRVIKISNEKIRQATIDEWRQLGFYYENDERKWTLAGSKSGLLNFCKLLEQYVQNPQNKMISEHEHFGPYMDLKIITWDKPMITKDAVYGDGYVFTVDEEYRSKLPKLKDDPDSNKYFILNNFAIVDDIFKKSKGRATIVIDNYYLIESQITTDAELVEVVEMKPER